MSSIGLFSKPASLILVSLNIRFYCFKLGSRGKIGSSIEEILISILLEPSIGVCGRLEFLSLLGSNIEGELLIFSLIGIFTLSRSLDLGYSYCLVFSHFLGHLLKIVRCPPL